MEQIHDNFLPIVDAFFFLLVVVVVVAIAAAASFVVSFHLAPFKVVRNGIEANRRIINGTRRAKCIINFIERTLNMHLCTGGEWVFKYQPCYLRDMNAIKNDDGHTKNGREIKNETKHTNKIRFFLFQSKFTLITSPRTYTIIIYMRHLNERARDTKVLSFWGKCDIVLWLLKAYQFHYIKIPSALIRSK